MSKPGSPVRVTRLRVEGRKARRAPVADRDAEASRFFDDPEFLRTALGERTDAESARDALDAARLARCAPGALILDAGCGPGCHALALARMGYRVVGLDRAAVLLAAGRRAVGGAPRLRFVRGDYVRIPFPDGSFDAVLNLGTALGYRDEQEDLAALREFRRVLTRGGRLVLETAHREAAEPGGALAEHAERTLPAGSMLRIQRQFDARHGLLHEVQQLCDHDVSGPPRAYTIRLYAAAELDRMLVRAGFGARALHGSLTGRGVPGPAGPLVIVAHAP
ncbi:MAG TPA: methyltransferase domain-containing protein [Candidatus Limnocylindria bacterium]|nr:methyltransferase domain-containing protein [Candidatus Limnocylindria bacterium]